MKYSSLPEWTAVLVVVHMCQSLKDLIIILLFFVPFNVSKYISQELVVIQILGVFKLL